MVDSITEIQSSKEGLKERPFRVLVVEDEPQIAELLKLFLSDIEGIQVDFVNTGRAEDALDILRRRKEEGNLPNLVLSDWGLAGKQNGVDLSRIVRQEGLANKTFILTGDAEGLISGYKTQEQLEEDGIGKIIAKRSINKIIDVVKEETVRQAKEVSQNPQS